MYRQQLLSRMTCEREGEIKVVLCMKCEQLLIFAKMVRCNET